MAGNQIQIRMVIAISYFLLYIVLRVDSTCYAQTCSSYASGCSTNPNCVCFQLVNGTGMCAAQAPTSGFSACTSNLTCTDNSAICVINSCFGQPLCYPLLYANYSTCSPSSVTPMPVSTKSTTPYTPSGGGGGGGNGGLDVDVEADVGAELGADAIGGIVAAVVVVVIIIVIFIILCVKSGSGC